MKFVSIHSAVHIWLPEQDFFTVSLTNNGNSRNKKLWTKGGSEGAGDSWLRVQDDLLACYICWLAESSSFESESHPLCYICLSACSFVCLCLYLSVCVCLSVCLSVCLYCVCVRFFCTVSPRQPFWSVFPAICMLLGRFMVQMTGYSRVLKNFY